MRPNASRLIALVALTALAVPVCRGTETAAIEARILDDLKFLAGPECEGRGTETQGLNKAADYIAHHFKQCGLKPAMADGSYFQPFTIKAPAKLVAKDTHCTLKGPQGQELVLDLGKQYTALGFSGSGKVNAPVVFVGYGITAREPAYDDFAGLDVAGKVVVILRGTPRAAAKEANPFPAGADGVNQHATLTTKASNAEIHKAAAVILVNDNANAANNDALRSFNDTAFRAPVGIPVLHVRRNLVNQMVRGATGGDLADLEKAIDRDLKPQSLALAGWACDVQAGVRHGDIQVKNVIGVLEGEGPLADETIIVGAHYDHLGYGESGSLARGSTDVHFGADDNGSGTVTVMELARRFGAQTNRKGRRLVFMTFAGEERGLLGSRHYCKNPIFPLDKTAAMINLDMVGRYRENEKLQILGVGTGTGLEALVEKLNEKHNLVIKKSQGGGLGFGGDSDHSSFIAMNVPALFFFTGLHPQYHRPTDTWDTINVAGIRRVADLVEDIMLALRPQEARPRFAKNGNVAAAGNPHAGADNAGNTPKLTGPTLGIMPDYGDEKEGILVSGVTDGRPAAKAGILRDDRIVELAGKPVKNMAAYMTILNSLKKGEKVEVTVIRKGEQKKIAVQLD
jgi:hypothetical protein